MIIHFKTTKKKKEAFTQEIQFTFSSVVPRDHFRTGPAINPPPNAIVNCWVNEERSGREMGGKSGKALIVCK